MRRASLVLLLIAAVAVLGDDVRIPSCCLPYLSARTALAAGRVQQRQEHHPGTCSNAADDPNPCKCHGTQCPKPGEKPTDPAKDDTGCSQYCDEGDCFCVSPCTTIRP